MDYRELADYRQGLLNLYKSLESSCEEFNESGYEIDSELRAMQENVEAERFLLAIFGEVKAGKSTFINALLKEAILPSDDLQATSEIIEVCKSDKSDKKKAEVTFVNGKEPVVIEDEVVQSLKEIASVNEEYRSIPIVQVNRFLSEHYSEEKGGAVYDDEELKTFLSSDLENTHNLEEEEFKRKICNYIDQNISCEKIPSWVSLYYPHDVSEFKHFRIVDTPGVNAIGGIEERTKRFINQADAVICLCNAGQLESRTLGNILENDLPKDVKKHLILVLTHRSDYPSNAQRNRILDHANNILTVGSDNIFFLDSLTELDLQKFYGAKTIDEINKIREEDSQLKSRTAHFYEEVSGNRNEFFRLLEDQANFREIRERIREDAKKSARTQMRQFAYDMQKGYKELGGGISTRIIAPLETKYKNPQFFAEKIDKQEEKMSTMKENYGKSKSLLRKRFSPLDENSESYDKTEQMVTNIIDKIAGHEFDTYDEDTIFSYIKELIQDYDDKVDGFVGSLEKEFVNSLRAKAQRITGKDIEQQSRIIVPIMSVDSVWIQALNEAEKEINKQLEELETSRDISPMFPFGSLSMIPPRVYFFFKRRRIKKSRPQQIWQAIQPLLKNQLLENKRRFQEAIDHFINTCCNEEYKSKFDEVFMMQDQTLKKLQKKEETNNELGKEIARLKNEKDDIDDKIQICQKFGGNL